MHMNIELKDDSSALPWEGSEVLRGDNDLPTVSIVIPVYNSGKFLEKTLRSLLYNDLNGVEIIMQDGGSTDTSHAIIHHYKKMFAKIYSEKDEGQSDAINKGYEKSTGKILYWLNGDDIILPNTLIRVREYFRDNENCHVVVGDAYMTELDFSPINHFQFNNDKIKFESLIDYAQNHLIQPSVFFSRTAWEKAGPLDINDHYAMDADLFICMSKNYKFHHLPLDIAYSVYHEQCKTRGARSESITSLALVQAKHGGLEQAKKTLDILVSLYNELSDKQEKITKLEEFEVKYNIASEELDELKRLIKAKQELLIKTDLEIVK